MTYRRRKEEKTEGDQGQQQEPWSSVTVNEKIVQMWASFPGEGVYLLVIPWGIVPEFVKKYGTPMGTNPQDVADKIVNTFSEAALADPIEFDPSFTDGIPCRRGQGSWGEVQGEKVPPCDGTLKFLREGGAAFPVRATCAKCGLIHGFFEKEGKAFYGAVL